MSWKESDLEGGPVVQQARAPFLLWLPKSSLQSSFPELLAGGPLLGGNSWGRLEQWEPILGPGWELLHLSTRTMRHRAGHHEAMSESSLDLDFRRTGLES